VPVNQNPFRFVAIALRSRWGSWPTLNTMPMEDQTAGRVRRVARFAANRPVCC